MKRWVSKLAALVIVVFMMGCQGTETPEKLEINLIPAEKYEGDAKGKVVVDTHTGTDINIDITGLNPDGLYTAFFVNVKSKMFEGIGEEPFVLRVDSKGTVHFQGKMKKDVYRKFVNIGIYLNPGKKPIKNPLGVKAKLGAIMKTEMPKMVLKGKLR